MELTRRRVLAAGAASIAATAGCTGTESDSRNQGADDRSRATDAGATAAAEWPWDGSIPVDGVVQHHEPSCGCCGEYAEYLEANGIDVSIETAPDLDTFARRKTELGVPESMRSCHTVEFGEYVVEGHVPLQAVARLFETDASVNGIVIPGMPQHAPGMGPPGEEPLTVYAFREDGDTAAFVDIG